MPEPSSQEGVVDKASRKIEYQTGPKKTRLNTKRFNITIKKSRVMIGIVIEITHM